MFSKIWHSNPPPQSFPVKPPRPEISIPKAKQKSRQTDDTAEPSNLYLAIVDSESQAVSTPRHRTLRPSRPILKEPSSIEEALIREQQWLNEERLKQALDGIEEEIDVEDEFGAQIKATRMKNRMEKLELQRELIALREERLAFELEKSSRMQVDAIKDHDIAPFGFSRPRTYSSQALCPSTAYPTQTRYGRRKSIHVHFRQPMLYSEYEY